MTKNNKVATSQAARNYVIIGVVIAAFLLFFLLAFPILLDILQNLKDETESSRVFSLEIIQTATAIT